jgi:hypothetical protein
MDETTIRVAIRATARISFVLFLAAFLGDALYRLMPAAATRRCSLRPNHLSLTAFSAPTSKEANAVRSNRRPLAITASIF